MQAEIIHLNQVDLVPTLHQGNQDLDPVILKNVPVVNIQEVNLKIVLNHQLEKGSHVVLVPKVVPETEIEKILVVVQSHVIDTLEDLARIVVTELETAEHTENPIRDLDHALMRGEGAIVLVLENDTAEYFVTNTSPHH